MKLKHPLCIVTDSSAQFVSHAFPGKELIRVLNLRFLDDLYGGKQEIYLSDLSAQIESLLLDFDRLLVIAHDNRLSDLHDSLKEVVRRGNLHELVTLIPSYTFGTGLGVLLQQAAGVVATSATELSLTLIRNLTQSFYTNLIVPMDSPLIGKTSMSHINSEPTHLEECWYEVTIDSEEITLQDILAKRKRFLESMVSFCGEFEDLSSISMLQGDKPLAPKTRLYHQAFKESFPDIPFFEQIANATNGRLLGEKFLAITVFAQVY